MGEHRSLELYRSVSADPDFLVSCCWSQFALRQMHPPGAERRSVSPSRLSAERRLDHHDFLLFCFPTLHCLLAGRRRREGLFETVSLEVARLHRASLAEGVRDFEDLETGVNGRRDCYRQKGRKGRPKKRKTY